MDAILSLLPSWAHKLGRAPPGFVVVAAGEQRRVMLEEEG